MTQLERYNLAKTNGTFRGNFAEFQVNEAIFGTGSQGGGATGGDNAGSGNDGGGTKGDTAGNTSGESSNSSVSAVGAAATSNTDSDSISDEDRAENAAKSTAESTRGGTTTGGLFSIGKKNIEPLSKSAQLAQWNAKYAKYSFEMLQAEQRKLYDSGMEGDLSKFINGLVNKTQAEQQAAQQAHFKALNDARKIQAAADAEKLRKDKAAAARSLKLNNLEKAAAAEKAAKEKAEAAAAAELAQAEANAKIIAAELARKKAEDEAAALAIIVAAEAEAKRKADEEEKKRKAAELAAKTEAQRIRNRRIKRLLSQGIVVRNGYKIPSGVISDTTSINLNDRLEFLDNDRVRRSTENERRIDIDALIAAEPQTKADFDAHVILRQSEFDLLMGEKYPWFVRELNMTPAEREQKRKEFKLEKERLELVWAARRAKNQKNYNKELARKAAEAQLKWQKLRDEEQQEVFEDTVNDDNIEIQEANSDSNNMTDIEKARNAIANLERDLGRPIVPHRDIIESTDSDFDIDSQLDPGDILIRDDIEMDTGLTEDRQLELLELKESMDSDEVEGLYITKKIAESKEKAAIDAVTDRFNIPTFGINTNSVSNTNKVSKLKLEESMKFIRANIRGAGAKYEYFLQNKIGNDRQAELLLLNSVLENPSVAIPDSKQFDSVRSELRQLKTQMGI